MGSDSPTIEVTPTSLSLFALGKGTPLVAVVRDADGNVLPDVTVSWTSTEVSVATVSGAGVVNGLRAGNTTIAANAEGVTSNQVVAAVSAQPGIWRMTSAGVDHTCGITPSGVAYCWGSNDRGQLGDGSTTISTTPVAVFAALTFQMIAASYTHTCAITIDGAGYCWGGNGFGNLGNGSTADSDVPVAVVGGLTFHAVAQSGMMVASDPHACAITSAAAAYCWGQNGFGQLGDGTRGGSRATPVQVSGDHLFQSIAVGTVFTCGLAVDGTAYCWGSNSSGQVGNGTTSFAESTPVAVSGDLTFTSLDTGRGHACGVTTNAEAYCWGSNLMGALGNGTTDDTSVPALVSGGVAFAQVTAGRHHACGITARGVAHCWGWNSEGQLGDGSTDDRHVPVAVAGDLVFQSISASGSSHTCGVTTDGDAYCWGAAFGSMVPIRVPDPV